MRPSECSFFNKPIKALVLFFAIALSAFAALAQDYSAEIKKMFMNKENVDITYIDALLKSQVSEYYFIAGDSLYKKGTHCLTYVASLKDIDFSATIANKDVLEKLISGQLAFTVKIKFLKGKCCYLINSDKQKKRWEYDLPLFFVSEAYAKAALQYLKGQASGNSVAESKTGSQSALENFSVKDKVKNKTTDTGNNKDSIKLCIYGNVCGYYRGEILAGNANGKGSIRFDNGCVYTGYFKDNKMNGQGSMTFTQGEKYTGEWKDNNINGQGTYVWTDGNTYTGQWKDSKLCGQGTYTFYDGEKYVGEFFDNKKNGQGTYTSTNGDKFVGMWKEDKKNGHGTMTYTDGEKYVGEYKNDQRNGYGSAVFPNGASYVGGWQNNKFHGQGTLTYPSGKSISGEFKNGKPVN